MMNCVFVPVLALFHWNSHIAGEWEERNTLRCYARLYFCLGLSKQGEMGFHGAFKNCLTYSFLSP